MNKAGVVFYFLLFSFVLVGVSSQAEEFVVPRLEQPVQDEAKLFSAKARAELSSLLLDVRSKGGPQIQVLTLQSLHGLPLEQATIKIVDAWALGNKDKDNGLLLLITKEERKIRIEVGQGLEGDLPDVVAKRIISRIITPFFKAGKMDQGLAEGLIAILGYVAPQYLKDQNINGVDRTEESDQGAKVNLFFIIGLFLLIAFLRIMMGGRSYSSGYRRGGGYFGGGGFGGGGSGGGWSGGGGGFSGGGASGDW